MNKGEIHTINILELAHIYNLGQTLTKPYTYKSLNLLQ